MKKIIFVATLPSTEFSCDYLEKLEKEFCVLHPAFDWESEYGKAALEAVKEEPPQHENPYKRLQLRDFWAINKSDLFLYDVDTNPGVQFLTAAVMYEKPIMAVSQVLQGAPAYFSPDIQMVCHPDRIVDMLHRHFA